LKTSNLCEHFIEIPM